ncbi:unnamed protein product [Arctogadus glacialis]
MDRTYFPPPHANPDQIHHVVVFSPAHTSSLVFNFQDGASSFNCKLKTKRYKKLYHSLPLQRHAQRPHTPRPVVGRALTAAELQRISHHLRVTLNKPTLRSPFFWTLIEGPSVIFVHVFTLLWAPRWRQKKSQNLSKAKQYHVIIIIIIAVVGIVLTITNTVLEFSEIIKIIFRLRVFIRG